MVLFFKMNFRYFAVVQWQFLVIFKCVVVFVFHPVSMVESVHWKVRKVYHTECTFSIKRPHFGIFQNFFSLQRMKISDPRFTFSTLMLV